jgi:hypothetical protein
MKTVYYFGFIWDIRTFLRTANYLQGFPSIMKFLKVKFKIFFFIFNQKINNLLELMFNNIIEILEHISFIEVFSCGTNPFQNFR